MSGSGSGGMSRRSASSASESTVAASVDIAGSTNGYGFRSTGGDALSIEMQFLNPRRRFPLADPFLPILHIAASEVAELRAKCESLAKDALQLTTMFAWDDSNNNALMGEHRAQWKAHFKRPHVTLYRHRRGKDDTSYMEDLQQLEELEDRGSSSLQHFVLSGQIHDRTLEDVEYGLYCDATLDERAVATDLLRELFLDAAVLRSFETQTPSDPFHFFGIKWLAHLSPADKFVSPRDYAYVEFSQRVTGAKGEPLLVKVQHPLPTRHVEAMSRREFDLVRARKSCTTVYRHDARANNVQVFARGYLDVCGSAPALMTRAFLSRIAPTLVEVEHSADVKYIMRHALVLHTEEFQARRQALKARGRHVLQCTACGKRFGRLKRHITQCRACGEAACGRCLITYTLCLPGHERRDAEHPSAVIPERFCLRCLYSGRLDRKGQRMDDFLTSTQHYSGPSTAALTVAEDDDVECEDDVEDDVSVLDFVPCHDGRSGGGGTMGAAITEAQRLQRLKQRYLDNEKRKYLTGEFDADVHAQMQQHRQQFGGYSDEWRVRSDCGSLSSNSTSSSARGDARPPLSRPGSEHRSHSSSASASASFQASSTSSSFFSTTDAAAAATEALQTTTGFHKMERSIAEQEAVLRSLQSEYLKVRLGRTPPLERRSPPGHDYYAISP